MAVEVTPLTHFTGGDGGKVHTLVLPAAVPAGDHLVLAVYAEHRVSEPLAAWITDPRGNSWQRDGHILNTDECHAAGFSARAATAYQKDDVLTVTQPKADYRRSALLRVTDLPATAWLDKVATAQADDANPITVGPTATLAQANEIGFAIFCSRSVSDEESWDPENGWTPLHSFGSAGRVLSWQYKIVASTAAVSSSGQYGDLNDYAAVLLTYKDAGAGLPADPTITATSLPDGTVGTAYNQTLTATGGASPYTWALESGNLPPGLALSTGGVISGTPTAAGIYEFTVRVTDANANTDTQLLEIEVASGGGPAVFQPFLGARWAFYLCDRQGARLEDISELAGAKKLAWRLSQPAQCTFRVPSNHEKIAALHTDGRPMLAPMRVLKGYRTFNGVTSLRFAGYVWILHDEGDELNPVTTVTCFDPSQKLTRVRLRTPNGTYRRSVAFTNTNAAEIVSALVARANTAIAAITGILDSQVDPTIPTLSITLEFRTVGQVHNELSATIPFDWRVDPLDRTDGYHGRLVMDALMKPGGPGNPSRPHTILGWGAGPANVTRIKRLQDVTPLANDIRVYGGSGIRKEAAGTSPASQTVYGVFEDLALYESITLQAYLEQIASLQLALRKQPRELVEVTPAHGTVHPWADFHLGDTFPLHAGAGLRAGFSGLSRLYGFDLDVDDQTGNETLSSLLVSPE